ncbi:MAG: (d)CMP kinase [Proteobacteria bacterium]|nr:MAG: (d)CMP kinase [Pseudomonadota bacterium]
MTTSKKRCIIVAVDGPAGSGKSSVCSKTCKRLGWTYVNTGFLYRAVAYICRQRQIALDNSEALGIVIDEFTMSLVWDPETQAVWFQGENISENLYTDLAGKDASLIAKNPMVREKLLPLQRDLALRSPVGAIVDGRDIGTVVFPDADLKVFLTASIEERARRRIHQLKDGAKASAEELESIRISIQARDEQDAARGVAPLIQAKDAILLDTSNLQMDSTIERLIELINEKNLV